MPDATSPYLNQPLRSEADVLAAREKGLRRGTVQLYDARKQARQLVLDAVGSASRKGGNPSLGIVLREEIEAGIVAALLAKAAS